MNKYAFEHNVKCGIFDTIINDGKMVLVVFYGETREYCIDERNYERYLFSRVVDSFKIFENSYVKLNTQAKIIRAVKNNHTIFVKRIGDTEFVKFDYDYDYKPGPYLKANHEFFILLKR